MKLATVQKATQEKIRASLKVEKREKAAAYVEGKISPIVDQAVNELRSYITLEIDRDFKPLLNEILNYIRGFGYEVSTFGDGYLNIVW